MRLNHLYVLILCAFLLNACRLPEVKKEAPQLNRLPPGTKFRINLPENHKTGYLWQLDQGYDRTLIRDLGPVWHGNEKGIDFNLKTLAPGQVTLGFSLRKYTDTSDIKTFIVEISDN